MRTVGMHHCFYFIQDTVGLGRSRQQRVVRPFQLFQVSHHNGSVQPSFFHLMKVYQNPRVACMKLYLLVEKHRGITMRIQGQDTFVQSFSLRKRSCLTHKPCKQRHHTFVSPKNHTFGMPLYPNHRFIFRGLHSLHNAIGCPCADPESGYHFLHCLMMKGGHRQFGGLEYLI